MRLSYKENFFIIDSLDGDTAREERRGCLCFLGPLRITEGRRRLTIISAGEHCFKTGPQVLQPLLCKARLTERDALQGPLLRPVQAMLAFPASRQGYGV